MKNVILVFLTTLSFIACNRDNNKADAYGNFETTEVTVSSESNGKIEFLNLEEGDKIEKNKLVGLVDTLQLHYTKMQLLANQKTIASKSKNVLSQKQVLLEQLNTSKIEQKRIHNMFEENSATKRQVDEIDGKVKVIEEQIKSVLTQNAPILNEIEGLAVQIEKINDQIQKSKITNPITGIVLTKYSEPGEITAFGKPLYKIANLDQMTLRVYIGEPQLSQIKIGQEVTVKIDSEKSTKDYKGTISWISAQAEFTPKVIQTKEERVNLVYAVKLTVKNDGSLKIGMPAEMWIKK
ncbi:MAG: HlyD family secretion protein [Flavobacterium sp.]